MVSKIRFFVAGIIPFKEGVLLSKTTGITLRQSVTGELFKTGFNRKTLKT